MPSKSSLILTGMALFLIGVAFAFLLGSDFKIIYVSVGFIGFGFLVIGFFIHFVDMFGKDDNSTKTRKQPWD